MTTRLSVSDHAATSRSLLSVARITNFIMIICSWCDPSELCCRRCPSPSGKHLFFLSEVQYFLVLYLITLRVTFFITSAIMHSTPTKLKRKNDGENDEKAWGKRPMYESDTSLEDSSLHLNELCITPPSKQYKNK